MNGFCEALEDGLYVDSLFLVLLLDSLKVSRLMRRSFRKFWEADLCTKISTVEVYVQ